MQNRCVLTLFLSLVLSACSSLKTQSSFDSHLVQVWMKLWSASQNKKIQSALDDYLSGREVSPGQTLGEKARILDLRKMNAETIRKYAKQNGFRSVSCTFWDFTKTPREPLRDAQGKEVPLWVFVHSDGSKIRVKPQGHPGSPHRPFPDATKSVLYPPDSDPCDYENEAFLVDHRGFPLPKQPQGLYFEGDKGERQRFLDSWAERTHLRLP